MHICTSCLRKKVSTDCSEYLLLTTVSESVMLMVSFASEFRIPIHVRCVLLSSVQDVQEWYRYRERRAYRHLNLLARVAHHGELFAGKVACMHRATIMPSKRRTQRYVCPYLVRGCQPLLQPLLHTGGRWHTVSRWTRRGASDLRGSPRPPAAGR